MASSPVACAPACDLACGHRVGMAQLRRGLATTPDERPAPDPAGPPDALCDERGAGTGLVRIAALAGADAGVVVVVADVPRRRGMLEDVLHPERIGVELAVLGGSRCAGAPLGERVRLAARRPSIAVLDYAALGWVDVPPDTHLVALDPPCDQLQAQWLRVHAAHRSLHLVWTEHEVAFARAIALQRWDLRPLAQRIWRNLAARPTWAWDAECEAALLGDADAIAHPDAVIDTLAAFGELGLIDVGPGGLSVLSPAERRPLEQAPRVLAASARLAGITEYLDRAMTLDLFSAHLDLLAIPAAARDPL
jgi:hypothetical protein